MPCPYCDGCGWYWTSSEYASLYAGLGSVVHERHAPA